MSKIFVSYRRDDSADIAGRIYDRLVAKFGREAVFKDVDSIPFGVNFKKYLESMVQQCAIELVVIGKLWLNISNEQGQRRLDDPRDFVRIEIESALARDIPVIPLLVSGASMPPENRLPDSLVELTYRNGTSIRRDPDFHHDMDRLIAQLERWLISPGTTAAAPPPTTPQVATPTRDQQAMLTVMLNTKRPPKERAGAGRNLAKLGDRRPGVCDFNMQWCNVPAGEFLFGNDYKNDPEVHRSEIPQKKLELPRFHICKYPITYWQYRAFVDAPDGYVNATWWQGLTQRQDAPREQRYPYVNHPALTVSWYDAVAYCRWLSRKLGYEMRLPTEEEWEKAARGVDGRSYPYGNQFEAVKGNTTETKLGQTSAVGIFPDGASPCEALDISGNVWEWTLSEYNSRKSNNMTNSEARVLRGGSFNSGAQGARAAYRYEFGPHNRLFDSGFRVVAAPG